jgi:hypothetical protein
MRRRRELFLNDLRAILARDEVLGVLTMIILSVPAVLAALLISTVSVEAAGFANRPDMLSRASVPPVIHMSHDFSRRQINGHPDFRTASIVAMKLTRRPAPISNFQSRKINIDLAGRAGRLSPEFHPVIRRPVITFESWYSLGSRRYSAMTFKSQARPMAKRFTAAIPQIIRFDRPSLVPAPAKTSAASEPRISSSSAKFCIGSMAPCGSWGAM